MNKLLLFLAICAAAVEAQPPVVRGGTFGGCNATNPSFSATPTFSLAYSSAKSPCRIEPGSLTNNVTSVTFTNKTAGAKFSIAWTQDGTGGRTVAYGASASNTCPVDPTISATTTQSFEVGSDGSTVYGTGCITTSVTGAINAQTSTYQVTVGDFLLSKTITVASGTFTITLVASTSQPANGQSIRIINYGSGVVTVARSGQNINGGTASLTLPSASATAPADMFIQSNGTDYFAYLAEVPSITTCTAPQVVTATGGTAAAVCAYVPLTQNSQSAAYTTVLGDAGKQIYHPGADTTARTWTIDSNANVAYVIGTCITFINDTSAGTITIAITSDTMILAGAGTTGSRTLAANGIATACKMTSTRWIINGTGLT